MKHLATGRRRRWPWVVLVVLLVLGGGCVVVWSTTSRAGPVTLREAESRLHSIGDAPGARRPASGVYAYVGSGSERLSFPPLSQSEGPTIPGTVTMQGSDAGNCGSTTAPTTGRPSTSAWRSGAWETGGTTSQLFAIGPVNVSTTSMFTCMPGTMWLPAERIPGRSTTSTCTGTTTAVKGRTLSTGPYTYVGEETLTIGGEQVPAVHFRAGACGHGRADRVGALRHMARGEDGTASALSARHQAGQHRRRSAR